MASQTFDSDSKFFPDVTTHGEKINFDEVSLVSIPGMGSGVLDCPFRRLAIAVNRDCFLFLARIPRRDNADGLSTS